MQLKMQEILGFASFYESAKSQKLSMKTAYNLARLAKAIDNELQFYREKLQAIIAEYGEKDAEGKLIPTEDGEGIKLRAGSEEVCFAAMRELQDIDINLPDIKFAIEDFGNIELSPAETVAIFPFIKE